MEQNQRIRERANIVTVAINMPPEASTAESSAEAEALNEAGVRAMLHGENTEALELLLKALWYSGNNAESRAQSLVNLADYCRRILGNIPLAHQIVQRARQLPMTATTKSRLMTIRAMVIAYPVELGAHDPRAISQAITILHKAMAVAKQADEADPKKFAAFEFAAHRLIGLASEYGTPDEKHQAFFLGESLLAQLDPDSADAARIKLCQAMMCAADDPKHALALLFPYADQLTKTSAVEAVYAWALIAKLAAQTNKKSLAAFFLKRCEENQGLLARHRNTRITTMLIAEATRLLAHQDLP